MRLRSTNFGAVVTALGLLAAALVVASGPPTTNYPCDDDVAQCPDMNGQHGNGSSGWGGCNSSNAWDFSDPPVEYNFYSCNAKSPDCGSPGAGECNIIAWAKGYGRTLTCEPAGTPQVMCMTEITSVTPLNIRCDNGQKCNDNGPNDTLPGGLPEAGDTEHLALPTPPAISWPD